MSKFLCCALAIALLAVPGMAQQGEGTGADFVLDTAHNGALSTDADKYICEGDTLAVSMTSPLGAFSGAGLMLLGDVAPISFDILEDLGVAAGLGTGINRFVLLNGITQMGASLPAAAGAPFTATFIIPAQTGTEWDDGGTFNTNGIVADDWGIYLQAFVASPTGIFGLIEVSNTVKHEVDTSCLLSDTCADAVTNTAGLTDADAGTVFHVNNGLFTNTAETSGTAGFGTQTGWTLEAAGAGTRQEAPEAFFRFDAVADGIYTFDLCASDYDSAIYTIETDCVTSSILNDDHDGDCAPGSGNLTSRLSVCLDAGDSIIVAIDGFGAGSIGRAEIVISIEPFGVDSQDINTGNIAGGETVNFTGCNLASISSVTVGGVAATGVVATATTLSAVVPASAAAGLVDIEFDGTMVGTWLYIDPVLILPFPQCVSPAAFITTGSPVASGLMVNEGAGATIDAGSVTVDLDVVHTFAGDLDMLLTSPAGTTVSLWAGSGGGTDLTLPWTLPGVNPDTGDFAPLGAGDFSEFDGENPNGSWTLDIIDNAGGDDGTLNMWCVDATVSFAPVSASQAPAAFITTGTPVADVLTVVGDTTIGSLTVDLDVVHTFAGDLDMLLTSPALTTVSLWAGTGGGTDLTLPWTLPGANPDTGDFAPLGAGDFSEFDGETTAGAWTLDIIDNAGGDDGTLNAWGINAN